jgi:hypothetical protein
MRQRGRCALAGLAVVWFGALTAAGGCNVLGIGSDGDGSETYDPHIDPADFVDGVDNPLFPLTPGTTYLYEADTPDGLETIEVSVTDQTREILGITCMVVRDTVTVDGELVEDTFDWYAQDGDGNVWYMGEDSKEYESGVVVSTAGSWEAGVDGAKPGIIMQADPQVGQVYRQEFYEGEAEDMGEVIALDVAVTLGDGTTYTCLQTRDFTPLEPDVNEYKYYAPGVGVVLEEVVDGDERVELVSVTTE